MKLFNRILTEGKERGLFDIANVEVITSIIHYCVKGIEVPYIRDKIAEDIPDETAWSYVTKIVFAALGRKPETGDDTINDIKI